MKENFSQKKFLAPRGASQGVEIEGEIHELLFSGNMRFTFHNDGNRKVTLMYTFPLPTGICVDDMRLFMKVRGRPEGKLILAACQKLVSAFGVYEGYLEKGKLAALLEQNAEGIYTARIANMKPNETVVLQIHFAHILKCRNGQLHLRFPTLIAPRYGNKHRHVNLTGEKYVKFDPFIRHDLKLSITLADELTKCRVGSPSHQIYLVPDGDRLLLKVDKTEMNRDFVLLLDGFEKKSCALCTRNNDDWMGFAF